MDMPLVCSLAVPSVIFLFNEMALLSLFQLFLKILQKKKKTCKETLFFFKILPKK
jgi:hypothetical protein